MKKILYLTTFLTAFAATSHAQSDNPCGAPALTVNSTCTNVTGSLTSSATNTPGVPAPGCGGYAGPDVWYSLTVPATGSVVVTMSAAAGGPADMAMAIYSGTCSALSLVQCNNDFGASLYPQITATGLTPGATVWVRIWEFGGGAFGNFQICAKTTGCTPTGANSTCAGATAFCTATTGVNYCNSTGVPSLGSGGPYGCLYSTPNPAFYYLHISSSGNINITINQTSTGGAGLDVDFVCWGPFGTQAAMCTGYNAGNIVDCSYSAAAVETVNIVGAVAGQWYLLLVTNYSGATGSITYTNAAGTTGATDCSITIPCSVSGTTTATTCPGSNTGSINATCTGSGPYTVNVVNSGGTTVATQSGAGPGFSFTGLPSGTYTLNASATGSTPACTSTSTVTISNGPAMTVNATSTNATCGLSNGTATATGTGPATITYNWFSDAAMTMPVGTGATISGLAGGTYYVQTTSTAGCTPATGSVAVAVAIPPSIEVTENSGVTGFGLCNGSATANVIDGLAPLTITWSNGTVGANNNTICAGLECATVTDANGCTDSVCIVMTEPDPLVLTLAGVDPLCFESCNGSVTSTVTGGVAPYTYSWSTTSTDSVLNALCDPGNYSLTVTDANGNTVTETYTINEPAMLVLDPAVVTNALCFASCDGTITASSSGGTGAPTYSLDGVDGGPAFTGICVGNYLLRVIDANGCFKTQNVSISQPTALTIAMSSVNASCVDANGSATATVGGGTPPYTYLWNDGDTEAANTFIASGTYNVDVTDANGCTIAGSVVVGNNPPLVIVASADVAICKNNSITVTANASGGSGGPYTITWTDAAGNPVPSTSVGANSTATVSPTTTTTYTATVDDGCVSSVSSDQVVVTVNSLPQLIIAAVNPAGCNPHGTEIVLTTDIGVNFMYDFECDGITDNTTTNLSVPASYNAPGTYDVCATAISAEGCTTSVSSPGLVTSFPVPLAEFTFTPNTASILTPEITFIELASGETTYSWDFGDSTGISGGPGATVPGGSGSIQQPEHTYLDTGTYIVTLTVENIHGCVATVSHPVVIEPDFEFFAPNAFTPNGDGRNDIFYATGMGISEDNYEFYVFDRWGQVIFKTTKLTQGWDGTFNGIMCKPDTYVWKAFLVDQKRVKRQIVGHVTLLR